MDIEKIERELNVSMAFLKAVDEVKQNGEERSKRRKVQAAEAAKKRRAANENRAAYEKWRSENPPTEEEKAEHRRKFRELIGKGKGGDAEK